MLTQEWNIQSRSPQCAVSGQPFAKGEKVYSALYWRDKQYVRVDLNAESWKARNDNIEPLSAWQTEFVPPPPAAPETLKKDDAESLLRRLVGENAPETRNARYILALMLERKKMLRQIERKRQEGVSVLVYEHLPSGDVWLIEDPDLKLGELQAVQEEVSQLLANPDGPKESPPVALAASEVSVVEPSVEPGAEIAPDAVTPALVESTEEVPPSTDEPVVEAAESPAPESRDS